MSTCIGEFLHRLVGRPPGDLFPGHCPTKLVEVMHFVLRDSRRVARYGALFAESGPGEGRTPRPARRVELPQCRDEASPMLRERAEVRAEALLQVVRAFGARVTGRAVSV